MKKLSLVIAVILVIAMLTGAASAAQMENGVLRAGEGAGKGYKILLLQQHRNNAFQNGVYNAAVAAAEELGCDLTILSSESDAATRSARSNRPSANMTPSCMSRSTPMRWAPSPRKQLMKALSSSTSFPPAQTGKATASQRFPTATM